MRKGKGSWAQVGIVSSMLCLCLGLASQTQHSAHTVLELEVLLAQKKRLNTLRLRLVTHVIASR